MFNDLIKQQYFVCLIRKLWVYSIVLHGIAQTHAPINPPSIHYILQSEKMVPPERSSGACRQSDASNGGSAQRRPTVHLGEAGDDVPRGLPQTPPEWASSSEKAGALSISPKARPLAKYNRGRKYTDLTGVSLSYKTLMWWYWSCRDIYIDTSVLCSIT